MLLAGQRSYFELTILDYEYAATSQFYTDRNTLRLALRAGWQQHRSTATAPLLLTWEVVALLDWFTYLLKNGRSLPRLQFAEPCLKVECISANSDEFLIQIQMAHEAAPDWQSHPERLFWLPVVVRSAQLREAVLQLQQQTKRFPIRS